MSGKYKRKDYMTAKGLRMIAVNGATNRYLVNHGYTRVNLGGNSKTAWKFYKNRGGKNV